MRILESIHQFDINAFGWCLRRKHRDHAIAFSRIVSYTANGPFYAIAAALFAYFEYWPLVQLLAIGFAIERVIYFICKTSFRRNRPPEAIPGFSSVIQPSDQFSFPSGHTSAAFFMTCAMASVFPGLTVLLYPWAICVGIARVMLGVHFPTDVLAGALMGHLICTALISILF